MLFLGGLVCVCVVLGWELGVCVLFLGGIECVDLGERGVVFCLGGCGVCVPW